MFSIYQKNKAKHLRHLFFTIRFLFPFYLQANSFVVATRNQNFTSQHEEYKGAGI